MSVIRIVIAPVAALALCTGVAFAHDNAAKDRTAGSAATGTQETSQQQAQGPDEAQHRSPVNAASGQPASKHQKSALDKARKATGATKNHAQKQENMPQEKTGM